MNCSGSSTVFASKFSWPEDFSFADTLLQIKAMVAAVHSLEACPKEIYILRDTSTTSILKIDHK